VEKSYDGTLESYNGEVLGIRPFENTQLAGPLAWTSTAGHGKVGGIIVNTLFTSGMDVDRTILTLRTKAVDLSFLLEEAIQHEPIDIPNFGVYIRSGAGTMDRSAYRERN